MSLPELPCIAFRILAERLVWSGASGHGARRGPWKCGWRSLGDLLPEVSDPFLLLICCQGQQEHVSGRGHIVVYCVRGKTEYVSLKINPVTGKLPFLFQGWLLKCWKDTFSWTSPQSQGLIKRCYCAEHNSYYEKQMNLRQKMSSHAAANSAELLSWLTSVSSSKFYRKSTTSKLTQFREVESPRGQLQHCTPNSNLASGLGSALAIGLKLNWWPFIKLYAMCYIQLHVRTDIRSEQR